MHIHQLTLSLAFKHILVNKLWHEVDNAQFLSHLSLQGLFWSLTIVYMATNGSVPLSWLYVLPLRPSL